LTRRRHGLDEELVHHLPHDHGPLQAALLMDRDGRKWRDLI
jgi:hypothetical protein